MSKFEEVFELLQEYDSRVNGPMAPTGPGDGYVGNSSDPNIVGNAATTAPNRFNRGLTLKPFADEANHHDNRFILPYPLEHIPDLASNVLLNVQEITGILITTLTTSELTAPEKSLLQEYIDTFQGVQNTIQEFAKDLDLLAKAV